MICPSGDRPTADLSAAQGLAILRVGCPLSHDLLLHNRPTQSLIEVLFAPKNSLALDTDCCRSPEGHIIVTFCKLWSGYRINLKVVPNCDYFNDNEANPTATLLCRKLQRRVGDKKEGNKMTLLLPTPQQLVPDFKGFACQVFKDVVAQHVKEALRKKKLLSFFLAPSHFHGKLVLDPNDLLDLIAEMPSSHSFKCDILLAADPVRCLEMVSSVFLVQLTSNLVLANQAEEGQNV
jgi:hypothetical protein